MKDMYVIMDTDESRANRLFFTDSQYIPWIVHSFTDELKFAAIYASREEAQQVCDYFTAARFDFDGDTPLKPGRLRVKKIVFAPVEAGG